MFKIINEIDCFYLPSSRQTFLKLANIMNELPLQAY